MSSFSTALSGLQANTTALDVVGDNLANMNTQGFKGNTIQFEDAMAQANESLQIGGGVAGTTTTRNFSQGSITTTGGATDAAIQGSGFFVETNSAGATVYSRDGSFNLNSTGQLVSSTGNLVQGWTAVNGVVSASGPTGSITVPLVGSQAPIATQNISLSANLDAAAATNDTFSAPIQVVDSLGETHTLTATFTKTGSNAWKVDVGIPGQDVTGGTAGQLSSMGTETLTFDSNGNLTAPAAPGTLALTNTAALTDGAATMKINWNAFDANGNATITQYAQTSTSTGTTQDGSQAATVTGVSLQNGGLLEASYSNGRTQTLAQVAVASIGNPDTLIGQSNNTYTLGNDTLAPVIGASGTGGRGNVVGGALEASNVDMATEFTNLIVFQQGYEANSKVLTTINQMDQTLLAIQI
jgi:flagellar hook protein FlgE